VEEEAEPNEIRCLKKDLMQPVETNQKPKRFAGILPHLHPKNINEEALVFTRTFGLGGMTALLMLTVRFYL
jgi:hypothetical protein